MIIDKLAADFKVGKTVIYSPNLIEAQKSKEAYQAFTGSVILPNNELPTILMTCNSAILYMFGIKLKSLPEPRFKFRMLNFNQIYLVLEIEVIFDNGTMAGVLLNPYDKATLNYLKEIFKTKILSVSFTNIENEINISGITNFEPEDGDWLARNIKLMSSQKKEPKMSDFVKGLIRIYSKNNDKKIFFLSPQIKI